MATFPGAPRMRKTFSVAIIGAGPGGLALGILLRRAGFDDFAIFDTFPGDGGRLAHLAGKVGRALVAKTPELLDGLPKIEDAQVLAYKLTDQSGEVQD